MFCRCIGTTPAAAYLGVSPRTLAAWRDRELGPPFYRLPSTRAEQDRPPVPGHDARTLRVVYDVESLDEWLGRYLVAEGRMPQHNPGRPPGSRNRPKARPLDTACGGAGLSW